MTTLTRALGALALTATGAAIMAQTATAHTVQVACVGNRIVATGDLFPVAPLVTEARLTVDGMARAPQIVAPGIPGPRPVYTFPELLYGQHVVIVTLRNGGDWTSPATRVVCGPPPQQPQTPAETPTGGGTVTTAPLTCAEYRVLYPKAGPNFWRALGCPIVKKPPVVEPPPKKKLTCADLKARGAGRAWYVRLRIPYYACNVPTPKRVDPPVAG